MLTISIDTDHTESRISWVGRVLLFCWLMEWKHFLCDISGGWPPLPAPAPEYWPSPVVMATADAHHAKKEKKRKKKKQQGKLSHMNNNIQSSPCFFFFFFLFFFHCRAGPALGRRMTHGHFPWLSFSFIYSSRKKKFLHHSPVARKMRMQEKTWRRRRRRRNRRRRRRKPWNSVEVVAVSRFLCTHRIPAL